MWLKLCLLLIYITVLFLLARLVEALTWYETGSLSRRLLDPMTLSVAKLKALLEQRGVNYDAVVEKPELAELVEGSGTVHEDEVETLQLSEETAVSMNTNFTSAAHFYEQVEDAKDSVWLVQVLARHYSRNPVLSSPLSETMWKSIRKKVTKFGVNTGVLDCDFDPLWCEGRGWRSSRLLLALPQLYQQKANVATHTFHGNLKQNAISHWIRQKLSEKIETILDFRKIKDEWLTFTKTWQMSEVRVLLFTKQDSVPMFFSALSVRFPGRVKFGVIKKNNRSDQEWSEALMPGQNISFPLYLIVTKEGTYVYGKNHGDCLTFSSMETVLRFLHPCLNDIFTFSFLVANLASVLEVFLAQGGLGRRIRKMLWCVVKYNSAVIMLWLPLIAIFQLPYLDHFPLYGLKCSRLLATSSLGEAIRRDIFLYSQHPCILAVSFISACLVFGILARKITGGRYEDENEPWFNFGQMRTLTHLRSNEFFEPMFMTGYDLSGGMEILGSRLYLPTMSLQPVVSSNYISQLPTWLYRCKVQFSPKICPEQESSEISQNHEKLDKVSDHSLQACKSNCDESMCTALPTSCSQFDGKCQCECEVHDARYPDVSRTSLSDSSENCVPVSSCIPPERSENPSDKNTSFTACSSCSVSSVKEETSLDFKEESYLSGALESSSVMELADFPEGFLTCSQCVICLEEYIVGVVLCGLPCGHVFHHSCIITWLQRDHHFCPICRWPSYHPRSQVPHTHAHSE